jgi:D-proline reductase (dithiol) PrdB
LGWCPAIEEAFRMSTMEEFGPEVRAFVSSYGWHRIDPVPWAKVDKPLVRSRVGLVVTACMTLPGQPPFEAEQPDNDPSVRLVPSGADPSTLVNTFAGQAFDHAGLAADANLLVPMDRLHELAVAGAIGKVSPRVVSLCGHLPKPRRLIAETAPWIAQLFVEDGADVVVLVPA